MVGRERGKEKQSIEETAVTAVCLSPEYQEAKLQPKHTSCSKRPS